MGQRLIIEIQNSKGELLATQYMHWSAYTGCSLEYARWIHGALKDMGMIREEPEFAVRLLRYTFPEAALTPDAAGALGVTEDRELNRNRGLIDITEKEMEENRGWGEGSLKIVLEEGRSDALYGIDCLWTYDDIQNFIDDNLDSDDTKVEIGEDGSQRFYVKNASTGEFENVSAHVLHFDGYTETWEDVQELDKIFAETEDRGWAYCVRYSDSSEEEKEYFVLQWIG